MNMIATKILLVLLAAFLLGCVTSHHESLQSLEEKQIRAITDDRRTWVDPK
jgi:hypothetical protein